METDFHTTLVDAYLVKVDRASMLTSLEIRAPMLNHHFMEFAFSKIPDHMKATTRDRKILLRRLAKEILPKKFDVQRKQGLSIPLVNWFKGPWGSYFRQIDNTLSCSRAEKRSEKYSKNICFDHV